jgi:uncharacterized protein (TIGR02391 family)
VARKGRSTQPDQPEDKVFTSLQEVDQAIVKLRRRLEDVQALDPQTMPYGEDPRISSAGQNFSDAVLSIYGPNSPEYRRFRYHSNVWHGSENVNMSRSELQAGFAAGRLHTIEAIENLIRRLEETRADFGGDAAGRIRTAFEGLDLHPRIAEACVDLYRNKHYRNAVLDASLALEDYVKQKSRCRDRDGADLMRYVFSAKNPVLAFNGLADDTDRSEQEGMMHLFEGVMLALRNPRAHTLSDDSPEQALEYIALMSLLAKRLEAAQRMRDP